MINPSGRNLIASLAAAIMIGAPGPAFADVMCVQEALSALGYDAGPVDGIAGKKTQRMAGYLASDYGLDLAPLTASNSDDWCEALRPFYLGAGAVPFDPARLEAGAPEGTREPQCTSDPPEGYARRITSSVDGDELALTVSARFGGAVDSLTWRGKEFINTYDHGRQISYAWIVDGWGECLNPTEPGSATDLFGQTSTSRLLSVCSSGPGQLTTTTQPAYWLAPGETGFCDRGATGALNETALSDHRIIKSIEIGYAGIENVITFDATINLPADQTANYLEAPTGYLTADFTAYYRFNPRTGEMVPQQSEGLIDPWSFVNSGALPPVLATPDGEFAMGAYSPGPVVAYEILQYDVSNPADRTSKWNVIFHEVPAPAGNYQYLSFVVVGTLDQVREGMQRLTSLHASDTRPPEGYVDTANCDEISGWAWDPDWPNQPLTIRIFGINDDGSRTLLAERVADRFRTDLESALGDNGKHGYRFWTYQVLSGDGPQRIAVEAVNPEERLGNAPLTPSQQALSCTDL